MKLVYLVSDDSKAGAMKPYTEQKKLFSDQEKAIAHAKALGYKDMWGLGFDFRPGVKHFHMQGEVSVSIMALEVVE